MDEDDFPKISDTTESNAILQTVRAFWYLFFSLARGMEIFMTRNGKDRIVKNTAEYILSLSNKTNTTNGCSFFFN